MILHASTTCHITTEWYGKFCQLCAANALDRNGQPRTNYNTLKKARDAATLGMDDQVPGDIVELFQNIYKATCTMTKFTPTMNDRTENVLLQVLLNLLVGYQLATGSLMFADEADVVTNNEGF